MYAKIDTFWCGPLAVDSSPHVELCSQFHQCSMHSFYARRSQKRKKTLMTKLHFFTLSGSTSVKAVHKMLMKLTPDVVLMNWLPYLNVCNSTHHQEGRVFGTFFYKDISKMKNCLHSLWFGKRLPVWLICNKNTLCPCYRDSPVNGDPTSVLVNGTPCYPDKMLFFCPDDREVRYRDKKSILSV